MDAEDLNDPALATKCNNKNIQTMRRHKGGSSANTGFRSFQWEQTVLIFIGCQILVSTYFFSSEADNSTGSNSI